MSNTSFFTSLSPLRHRMLLSSTVISQQRASAKHVSDSECDCAHRHTVGAKARREIPVRSNCQKSVARSEEHTSELQSRLHLVCRLLLEKKKKKRNKDHH